MPALLRHTTANTPARHRPACPGIVESLHLTPGHGGPRPSSDQCAEGTSGARLVLTILLMQEGQPVLSEAVTAKPDPTALHFRNLLTGLHPTALDAKVSRPADALFSWHFQAPIDLLECESQALAIELARLKRDLREHICPEGTVLFPRVLPRFGPAAV